MPFNWFDFFFLANTSGLLTFNNTLNKKIIHKIQQMLFINPVHIYSNLFRKQLGLGFITDKCYMISVLQNDITMATNNSHQGPPLPWKETLHSLSIIDIWDKGPLVGLESDLISPEYYFFQFSSVVTPVSHVNRRHICTTPFIFQVYILHAW